MSRHMRFLGLCIVDHETGKHENHIFFTAEEMAMPGYVDTVRQSYAGSQWEAVPASDCPDWRVTDQ